MDRNEFVFTFDDGSEVLAHYGVKGMKWGKWNAETRRRYAGAGNGTYYKKASRGSDYGKAVTDLRRAYNANQPKGKQIAKNVLLGPGGAHAYNTSRSRGLSRSESLSNAPLGPLYAQGVKHKQKKLGTTKPMVSNVAKERSEYAQYESFGKTVAKQFLAGYRGSTVYNTVKARTKSRGKAAVAAVLSSAATGIVGDNPVRGVTYAIASKGKDKSGTPYKKQVEALKFEKRSPLEKLNNRITETDRKRQEATAKYGPYSRQHKKALDKYGKAKDKFQKEYDKFYPNDGHEYNGPRRWPITVKSRNPNPEKYEVWDETMTKKENIKWNKEHNGGSADARKANKKNK